MKKTQAILVILVFVIAIALILNVPLGGTNNQLLIEEISSKLNKDNNEISVSHVHKGDWTYVCVPQHVSLNVKKFVSHELDIQSGNIEFLNGWGYRNFLDGESEWAVIFFYPPNKIEYFSIPYKTLLPNGVKPEGSFCRSKATAFFTLQSDNQNMQRIKLIEKG